LRIHTAEHVRSFKEGSDAGGGSLGLDAPYGRGSYEIALQSAGLAIGAVDAVLSGRLDNAYALSLPPGHHALADTGMGFCFFANIAIAIEAAKAHNGLGRVAVVDWDVHHGNGTNALFHDSREVLFVSIHQWPFWPGTGALDDVGEGDGEGYSINVPVPAGTGEAAFLSLIEHVVMPVGRQYRPDLILISAGYDAHRHDPLGGLALDTRSYGGMARRMRALGDEVGAPVGAVLEGGYDLQALADSVIETMAGLEDGPLPPEVARHPIAEDVTRVAGRYWDF
jgi:acetoin utilization deacetylase AcuC-like enzyme